MYHNFKLFLKIRFLKKHCTQIGNLKMEVFIDPVTLVKSIVVWITFNYVWLSFERKCSHYQAK